MSPSTPLPAPSRRIALLGLALACAGPALGQATAPATDVASVQVVVRAFHDALRSGDTAQVERLLAPDAVVLEGGQQESRAEYLSHHLAADIAFAKAVPSQVLRSDVTLAGDTAWVHATRMSAGTYRGRPVKLTGAELMVLSRQGPAWVIRAIHWSSASVK